MEAGGPPTYGAVMRPLPGSRPLLALVLSVPFVATVTAPAHAAEPVSVLPLGDSITYGATLATVSTPGGYRGPLVDDLASAGVPLTYVGTTTANPPLLADAAAYPHDGWPGARVDQVDEALVGPSALDGGHWLDGLPTRAGLDPDVVVVHLGTNDIGQAWDPGTTYPGGYTPTDPVERAVFVEHLADRLTALVLKAHASEPDAAFVVCTIVPMADPTAADYNQRIRDVVVPGLAAAGVPVALADVERAVGGTLLGVGPDGVHPTGFGYDAMAATIAPAVVAAISAR